MLFHIDYQAIAEHLLKNFPWADRTITRANFGDKLRAEFEPLLQQYGQAEYERGLKARFPHEQTEATPQTG